MIPVLLFVLLSVSAAIWYRMDPQPRDTPQQINQTLNLSLSLIWYPMNRHPRDIPQQINQSIKILLQVFLRGSCRCKYLPHTSSSPQTSVHRPTNFQFSFPHNAMYDLRTHFCPNSLVIRHYARCTSVLFRHTLNIIFSAILP